jgi:phosphohistidine phosphatase
MDLILWRHAEAEPGEPDFGRRLTSKGVLQAERVGLWLDQHLPDSCRIIASPAQRAQETVQVLNRRSRTIADLAQGASVSAVLAAAGWPDSREPVLVVAHQPTLGAVAAFLLSGQEASWSMRKGAVWWLSNRVREGTSAVVLKAMIGPDFVSGAAQPIPRPATELAPSLLASPHS